MRIFLFFSIILILSGCNTVEIAKEVTKASSSIKTSVKKIVNSEAEVEKKKIEINKNNQNKKEKTIIEEKKILENEKKEDAKLVKEQKKIAKIIFLGKSLKEINLSLGSESLKRLDGNTKTLRYDTNSCRLFFFFSAKVENPIVEHFEIRDTKGVLINTKKKIESCYKKFNLI